MSQRDKTTSWYSESGGFFGSKYLEEYKAIIGASQTIREVRFIEGVLKLPNGARILDVPCGHCRHAIELARLGYQVTGQDINTFFLKKADKDAKSAGVNVEMVRGDMRHISFQDLFDAAIDMFSSFGYLESDEEDFKVLLQIRAALKSGGKFILDVINRERVIRNYRGEERQNLPNGDILIIERRFDFITGRNLERRFRISPGGVKKRRGLTISMRMYTLAELISMCRKAGFQIKAAYGDYNFQPFGFGSKRCIVVARKI